MEVCVKKRLVLSVVHGKCDKDTLDKPRPCSWCLHWHMRLCKRRASVRRSTGSAMRGAEDQGGSANLETMHLRIPLALSTTTARMFDVAKA